MLLESVARFNYTPWAAFRQKFSLQKLETVQFNRSVGVSSPGLSVSKELDFPRHYVHSVVVVAVSWLVHFVIVQRGPTILGGESIELITHRKMLNRASPVSMVISYTSPLSIREASSKYSRYLIATS